MTQAKYYTRLNDLRVKCILCPRNCIIESGNLGACNVRRNMHGKLYSLSYEHPCSIHDDPVEKKPLFHFLPGARTLSVGTLGCNLFCRGCQNHEISRACYDCFITEKVSAETVVKMAKSVPIIAYTYNEPTVFFEYMQDISLLARKAGIKNVMVSNGYINENPLREICRLLDAANIDLKGFTDKFYKEYAHGDLETVKRTIRIIKELDVHLEITYLVIPGWNDEVIPFQKMCAWISGLNRRIPLHISRFYPHYKASETMPTQISALMNFKKIAEKHLDYVYLGNAEAENNTLCPKCRKILVKRNTGIIINTAGASCSCGEFHNIVQNIMQ